MTLWVIIRIFSLYWLSIFAAIWESFDKKASLHTFTFIPTTGTERFLKNIFLYLEIFHQSCGGWKLPITIFVSNILHCLPYRRHVVGGTRKINNNQWTEEESTIFANTMGCCSYKVVVLSLFWFVTRTCTGRKSNHSVVINGDCLLGSLWEENSIFKTVKAFNYKF